MGLEESPMAGEMIIPQNESSKLIGESVFKGITNWLEKTQTELNTSYYAEVTEKLQPYYSEISKIDVKN